MDLGLLRKSLLTGLGTIDSLLETRSINIKQNKTHFSNFLDSTFERVSCRKANKHKNAILKEQKRIEDELTAQKKRMLQQEEAKKLRKFKRNQLREEVRLLAM